ARVASTSSAGTRRSRVIAGERYGRAAIGVNRDSRDRIRRPDGSDQPECRSDRFDLPGSTAVRYAGRMRPHRLWLPAILALSATGPAGGAGSFVTFESGQVRPLALSPDKSRLFAVNPPDDRLEVFDVTPDGLTHAASIPVGLEPVAVAARSNG